MHKLTEEEIGIIKKAWADLLENGTDMQQEAFKLFILKVNPELKKLFDI